MRHLFIAVTLAAAAFAQRGEEVLGWRVAPEESPLVRRLEGGNVAEAVKRGTHVVLIPSAAGVEDLLKAAAQHNVTLALDATSGAMLDVEKALAAVKPYDKRLRVWVNPTAWEKAGTRPLAAIYMLREYLAGASLAGQTNDEFMREAYRLDIKPLVWTVPAADAKRVATTVEQLVSYHQSYASRTQGVRRLGGVSAEERAKIEAAIPTTAPARPKKTRKLLVFDLNVGRFGHPSIPHANLAMQLMGSKTGAFEATVTSDPAMLQPASLRKFDAVFLNNTIGDIFSTAEARDSFAEFVRNGGGVMGNHATTVTMTEWPEFGEILGARGASHRMTDERVIINVEDPGHPVVKAFGSGSFEYADEIFRFQPPYSRDKVRVLLSMDPVRTDMNQGRCYGQCYRDDNDYPIAWIRQYGKGRVFYTTLGHNPHVFWQPNLLHMFLAAAQYILGDLDADATPRPQVSALDKVLPAVARYDWGDDETPVRQLDRAMGLPAADAEQKLLATLTRAKTLGAKDAIVRQLAIVGTATSVPALAPMLADTSTADIARYALERIEGSESTAALRKALSTTTDARVKAGIIHSLARRRDSASVPELRKLNTDEAINALGIIGTPEAGQALLAAKLTPATGDALLGVAQQSERERALSIYKMLAAADSPDELRVAAIHGLARLGASDVVAQALTDASPNVQTAAVTHLPEPTLLAVIDKLAPAQKIQALAVVTSPPAFRSALKSDVPQVRIAALEGLSKYATEEDVLELVARAATTTGDEQTAARTALNRAPGIDAAIAASIPSASQKHKLELIRAVGERGNRSASDAVLASVLDSDPAVRREALRALRGIARPEQSAAILQMLLDSEDDRDELQRALAASLGRAEKPDIHPVVAAFDKSQDSETRGALLGVLSLTGEKEALAVLRKALGSDDATVQRAAIAGLSEWPSTDPMSDLLNAARTASSPAIKALALRGYVRLIQRPAGRPAAETAKLLGAGMSAASRAEEKKVVLAALQRVASPEALAIARAAQEDPGVAAEATLAVTTIEKALAARGR